MSGDSGGPIRTCIACRQQGDKQALTRVVLVDRKVVVDKEKKLPGRGAYIHLSIECISRLREMHRWERAFRCKKDDLDKDQIIAFIEGIRADLEPERKEQPKRGGTKLRL